MENGFHSVSTAPAGSVSSGAATLQGLHNGSTEHNAELVVSPEREGSSAPGKKNGRSTEDPSAPLPLMQVGHGGIKLKKSWGPGENGKATPPPALGVVGCGFSDTASGVTPRPPSSPKRPPSHGNGHAEYYLSPPASAGGRNLALGSVALGPPSQQAVSKLDLVLDSPPITSRRLAPAAGGPRRSPSGTNVLAASVSPGAQRQQQQQQVMRIDQDGAGGDIGGGPSNFPSASAAPPAGVEVGGADEVRWLRAQLAEGGRQHQQLAANLQRVQQESHAFRSSLLAQQQNQRGDESERREEGSGDERGGGGGDSSSGSASPHPNRGLVRRGSISNMLPPGQRPPSSGAAKKNRLIRKRAPQLSRGGTDDESDDILHVHEKTSECERAHASACALARTRLLLLHTHAPDSRPNAARPCSLQPTPCNRLPATDDSLQRSPSARAPVCPRSRPRPRPRPRPHPRLLTPALASTSHPGP